MNGILLLHLCDDVAASVLEDSCLSERNIIEREGERERKKERERE